MHFYSAGPNDYTVSGTYTDSSSNSSSADSPFTIHVNDVPPKVHLSDADSETNNDYNQADSSGVYGGPAQAIEGQPLNLSVSAYDPGGDAYGPFTINWGDNTSVTTINDTGVALGATNVPDTLTIGSTLLPHQLHHNVGATFNSAGSAPINKAVFASTTALAGKIAASVEMQKKVKDLLSIKKDDVVAAMRQSGKSSDWITWDAATDPSVATGFSAIHLHADWDLWYAIGDASLAGFKVSAHVLKRADGSYWADIISVQGQLLDLYDFDWDFPHLNLSSTAAGAAIQARYNAAGDPGHVFKVEVNFNNDTGVQWNF